MATNLKEVIGDNVKEARGNRGLKQAELAKLYGTTQSHISEIEKGTWNISVDTLEKLANILDVEPYDLLRRG